MDVGHSNFKFRTSCFDTSIVTHNRLTLDETGIITLTFWPLTFILEIN